MDSGQEQIHRDIMAQMTAVKVAGKGQTHTGSPASLFSSQRQMEVVPLEQYLVEISDLSYYVRQLK